MTAQALKQAIAFLFRRAAEAEIGEDALVRQASLDLHWFSPRDARRFVDAARVLGYLEQGSAPRRVRPAFDTGAIDVPLDFRIDARALEGTPRGPASPVTEELVAAASRARAVDAAQIWREVAARQSAKLLEPPVAAALLAAEAGVDLKPYMARIKDELAALGRGANAK